VVSIGFVESVTLSGSEDPQEINANKRVTVKNFLTIFSSYQIYFCNYYRQ
jgi:hypothetical protein